MSNKTASSTVGFNQSTLVNNVGSDLFLGLTQASADPGTPAGAGYIYVIGDAIYFKDTNGTTTRLNSDLKASVKVATIADSNWTTSATLAFVDPTLTITSLAAGSSLGLIDAVEPVATDRILIKDATTASTGANGVLNGLWRVTGGTTTSLTLVRTDDLPAGSLASSLIVSSQQGTVNSDKIFICNTNSGSDIVGTNTILFTEVVSADSTQTLSNKTLITPTVVGNMTFDEATNDLTLIISDQTTGVRTATVPDLDANDTFVFELETQTMSNKTLAAPTVSGDITFDEATNNLTLAVADQGSGAGTANIPDLSGADTFAFLAATQSLSNKTLSAPTVSGDITFDEATNNLTLAVADQGSGAGTANIPDLSGSDTFAFLAATQTMSNKSLTSASLTTPTVSGNVTFDEATNDLVLAVADQTGGGNSTANIPDLANTSDTFAFLAATQTMSNKTLSAPTVSGDITFDEATNNLTLAVADQGTGAGTANIPDLSGADTFAFLAASQVLTNKVLIDSTTTFRDETTASKQMQLQLSGVTGTVTLTVPDENGATIATRAYADSVAQGLDIKESVRVATTANITLSGTQTIDGVALIAGDRVLVKNQGGTASNVANGIYDVAAGAWSRSADADTDAEVTSGMFTFVEEGTVNGGCGHILITPDPITLGVTALEFTAFSGAGSFTGADGIDITGNVISVDLSTNSGLQFASGELEVNAGTGLTLTGGALNRDTIDLSADVTSTLPVANGGTGAATLTSGNFLIGDGTNAVTTAKAAPTGDVIGTSDTQTMTNKTLTSATLNTPIVSGNVTFDESTNDLVLAVADQTGGGDSTANIPDLANTSDTFAFLAATQALTNKTITDSTNSVEASQLRTSGAAVVISAAAPPTTGQALVATSATVAAWQTVGGGSSTLLDPARLATTANITLSGAQSIDSVAVVTNDRILVKDQTNGVENGVYLANTAGAWTRATDLAAASSAASVIIFVQEGTVNVSRGFYCASPGTADTVGTDSLLFLLLVSSEETFRFRQPVRIATTVAGTLASDYDNGKTVDGVVIATGDRILIKNQSTGSENGIYTVNASGIPTRSADMPAGSGASGTVVVIEEGSANADKILICSNNRTVDTVGSDSLAFNEVILDDITQTMTNKTLDGVIVSTSMAATGDIDINKTGTADTEIGNSTGTVTVLGATTNINTNVGSTTNIGPAGGAGTVNIRSLPVNINTTGSGNSNIGNTSGTVTVVGSPVNVNTTASDGNVSIGNANDTVTIVGDVDINKTGSATTEIAKGTGNLSMGNTSGNVTVLGTINVNAGAQTENITIGNSASAQTNIAGNALDIQSAGALTIDSSGSTIGIGTDSDTGAINIGTSATARTISLGSSSSTAVNLDSGGAISIDSRDDSNITMTTAAGGTKTLTISATNSVGSGLIDIQADGDVTVDSSGGNIGIGTDADTGSVNIGTSASARTINVGSSSSTAVNLVSSGATTITSSPANINNTGSGTVNIGTSTSAQIVNIGSGSGDTTINVGTSAAGAINIGSTDAGAIAINSNGTIDIGNTNDTGTISVGSVGIRTTNVGNGNSNLICLGSSLQLNSSTTGTVTLGNATTTSASLTAVALNLNTSANANTVNISTSSSAAQTVNIGSGNGNTSINVGTGGSGSVTIGSTTSLVDINSSSSANTLIGGGAGIVNINSTGGINLGDSAAGAITIESNDAIGIGTTNDTGTISIGTDGLRVLNIATGTVNQTVNIGTGSGISFVNVGTSGAGTISLGSTDAGNVGIESGGTINIGTTNDSGAINIGTDGTSRTISIGTGTVAQTVNIGSGSGGTTMNLGINGSGVINIGSTNAGTVTMNSNGAINIGNTNDTGTISLGIAGARTVDICDSTTDAQTVSIGTNGGTTTIDIGTGGGGAITLGSTNAGAVAIESSSTIGIGTTNDTGAISIGSDGARTINVGTTDDTGTINIGTGSGASTIGVGTSGAGAITLGSTAAGAIAIESNGTIGIGTTNDTGAISIGSDGARTINMGTSASAAQTVNIGTGAGASTVNINNSGSGVTTIGNSNGTLNFKTSGTGVINMGSNANGAINIKGSGSININSSGGGVVSSLNLGTIMSGNVNIGSQASCTGINMASNGVVTFNASTVHPSDERLKKDIESLNLGLDFINELKPKSYKWDPELSGRSDDDFNFGFMAQDVRDVINDHTAYSSDGTAIYHYKETEDQHSISYNQFIAPLVKAVQELSAKVNELQARLDAPEE